MKRPRNEGTRSRSRILIAEDDGPLRDILTLALTEEGFTVIAVANGAIALDAIKVSPVDLIVLDTRMPVMDGHEFLREFRQMAGPYIPIVGISADSATLAADVVLAKPFALDTLFATVRRFIQPPTDAAFPRP